VEYAVNVCKLLETAEALMNYDGVITNVSSSPGVKSVTGKPGNVKDNVVVSSSPMEKYRSPENGACCAYIV
jgi:hypothetical protein